MDSITDALLTSRGLVVPQEDEVPLAEHWKRMCRLRQQVDEKLLADSEIAVMWIAIPGGDA